MPAIAMLFSGIYVGSLTMVGDPLLSDLTIKRKFIAAKHLIEYYYAHKLGYKIIIIHVPNKIHKTSSPAI